jgi:NAD dependent epimerase/dehydratase family enzyme
VLARPTLVPLPATALRATLGDLAEESALLDLRVVPERLLAAGYSFRFPTIDSALSDILDRPAPRSGA